MLKMEFRNEILSLGPTIGQYDEKLFIDYLEENEKTASIFKNYNDNVKEQKKHRVNLQRHKVQQYCNSFQPLLETQTPLVVKYLHHFCFEQKGSLKNFEKYFSTSMLKDIENKVKI